MNFCIFEGHGKEGIARREGTALDILLLATTSELPQWDALITSAGSRMRNYDHVEAKEKYRGVFRNS